MKSEYNKICALEPCYGPNGGNATKIYTKKGEVIIDHRRTRSLLKYIARQFNVDLEALRRNYGTYLACSQYVPICFSRFLVFISVKTRSPLGFYDGAIGYVNLDSIVEVKDAPGTPGREEPQCFIHLEGGQAVPSLFSSKNISQQMARAKIARDYFCYLQDADYKKKSWQEELEERFRRFWEIFGPPFGPDTMN